MSSPSSRSSSYALHILDLQDYYLRQAEKVGQNRPLFEKLTDTCLNITHELKDIMPALHVFTYQDIRRAYGFPGNRVYYDPSCFKIIPLDQKPADIRKLTLFHLDALYDVANKDTIVKYAHSPYGHTGSFGHFDRWISQNNVNHNVLLGAFADNCIWSAAHDSASRGINTTILLDCTASRQSPSEKEALIQENYACFAGLQQKFPDRLHLMTHKQFMRSLCTH